MATIIGDTIQIGNNGKTTIPLDVRDQFSKLEDMVKLSKYEIDLGHISLCKENNKQYIFRSDLPQDSILGFWREYPESMLEVASDDDIENIFK